MTNIIVTTPVNTTGAPVTNTVANHAEKPEKFIGQNFKRWQQNMFFYLTTFNLAQFLKETAPQVEPPRKEVILNGDAPVVTASVSGGTEAVVPPKTVEQKIARRNELKAKRTMLLAILDEHLLKFHSYKDAKTLWEAIKNRFGGNKESKKIQKTILKPQYENFAASRSEGLDKTYDRSEGLDKTYDRFQKLISQLEILGEVISQEDANLKLLRSLPPCWNNITLIMRNKSDLETLSMDDLYNNLKVYEAEIKGQSSSSSNTQNVAFVSSKNTSSTNEEVNTALDVTNASSQGQGSALTYADDVIFSFFANQSNSPQVDNEDLEQIDTDDLEEIDLKWQVAMITMRVKRFIKKTRRNMNFNGKENVGFDKTKVECYNCHRRGHFARECRAPRNQGNRNGDNTRRIVPVETPTNALIVTDGMGYDWSYQAKGPTDFSLMSHSSTGSSSSSSLDTEVRDNSIKELKNQLEEALKEKDDLKLKLEKFETSSKKLTKLIDSQISVNNKTGIGFDSQMNENELCDSHMNKSEVFESASDSSENESEEDNNQVNDRYKAGEGYHAVTPPYTGNFMPPRPDLSFTGLDDFVFKPIVSETINVTSVPETKINASKTSKDSLKKPKSVRTSAPLIEEWESNSDDDCVIRPSIEQNKSSYAKINFVKSNENTRKSVFEQHTHRQAKNLRKRQNSRVDKRNWNAIMTKKLRDGFEFKKKACFVCGSLNHLINDCNFYENKTVGKYVFNNEGKTTGQREVRPIWNNAKRGNPQYTLQDQGIFDSECSRHMTGNKSYLTDYQEIDGGFVV
ncbi:ribonuclease H-like domain-containing protein [Tanacetum coccineum]